jgi:hypothetical protein
LNRGKSVESLDSLDDKFEVQENICRIQYDQLTIDMFRYIYNDDINPKNLSFDTFRLSFFRSCDELKFYILNFLMISHILKIYPEVNCVADFQSLDIDQLNKMLEESKQLTINFQDFNGKTHFIAATGVNAESIKIVLQNILNAFIENEKQAAFFNNELLIFQLGLKKLMSINWLTQNGKENVFHDSFKRIEYSGLLNHKNFLNETLINLILEYFQVKRNLDSELNKYNSDFIYWLLDKNDKFPTLNNILAGIYISRIDLINSFRQGEQDWFKYIFAWFIEYGWKELELDKLFDSSELTTLLNAISPIKINERKGASVISYFKTVKGLGEAAKSYGKAIELLNLEVNYADIVSMQDIESNSITYGELNILGANGDQLPTFFNNLGFSKGFPRKSIGIWFWELDKLTPNFQQGLIYIDKIWAPTKFNYETFKSAIDLPIDYVPMPILKTFDFSERKLIQGEYFINIFDFLSDFNRKNPMAAIEAFNLAFPIEGSGPKLLIKSTNSVFDPQNSKLLANKVSERNDIIWIDEVLPENQLNYLIKNSMGLISLHRSEGFGMNIANAMQMMVPTIASAYSGNMDFCNEQNSFLVNFNLVPVETENVNYANMKCNWADPDISAAAGYLIEIHKDSKKVDKIVNTAVEDISNIYAVERIMKLMKKSIKKTKFIR